MNHRHKFLLSDVHKRALFLAIGSLWLTGVAWLVSREGSSCRRFSMQIHGAAAMIFLTIFGALLLQHIPQGWSDNRQRPSGGWLVGVSGILMVSGWGLYYLGSETVRHATSLVHSIAGAILPILLLLHIVMGKRQSVR